VAWRKGLLIVIALGAIAAAALWLDLPAHSRVALQRALAWSAQLGAWAPLIFILVYIVACVAVLPAAILTLGAGALFGVVRGSIYVSIGATLGATAAFLVGRYLARDWVTRRLAAYPKFAAIDHAVAGEGWRIVFLTRLCPLFPFFLLNYAFGLTRVSLRHFVLATWIGIMPGSTLVVYIGSLANSAAKADSNAGWIKAGFILVTAIVGVAYITQIARRALARRIE
jgi:uncharacterized membrane protein YdjX (TVP38/TMEM64 family)